MKNQQHAIGLLILIMATVTMLVGGIAISLLYREAYQNSKRDLVESVMTQATLIEAVIRSSRNTSASLAPGEQAGDMIRGLYRALHQKQVQLGKGKKWLIGQKQGDSIRFVVTSSDQAQHETGSMVLQSASAAGMRLALSGQHGATELLDSRGEEYLVAYTPIPSLELGLVNKISLTELRAPFLNAAGIAAGFGFAAIGLGTVLFARVGQTITRRLQQSEQRLAALLQTSPVGVFEADPDGGFTYVNERWSEITGIGATESIGQGWCRTLHPDDLVRTQQEWRQATEASASFQSEYRFQRFGQAPVWVYGQAAPIRNSQGACIGYAGTITNITERKLAESALRESQSSLAEAQRVAHLGNWLWDIASDSMEWSDETYRILGCQPRMVSARHETFLGFIHPEDREMVKQAFADALAGIRPYSIDHRIVQPDGTVVSIHAQGEVTFNASGSAVRMLGTLHDVTRLRHYERELKELNESLEQRVASRTLELLEERNFISTILETVGALVLVLDSRGGIIRFNRACESTSGYTLDELRGRTLWDTLIPPEYVAEMQQHFSGASAPSLPHHMENEWLTKSGRRRLISWTHSTLRDQHGATLVIATGIDITSIRETEQALLRAKLEAEQASQAKSDFLSRMSHELRTPMNAILGFSQLLEADSRSPLTDEQLDNVQEILKAGNHLLDLINEVLDLARIETGHMTCVIAPTYLYQVAQEASRLITPEAQQRDITLISKIAPCEQAFVMADQTRLRQVLLNLLSNAVKYNNPSGSILIACEELGDNIRLSITDTGNGIAPDKLEQLFLPFERLGAEFGPTSGTGIGLALSRQLVQLMGGNIGVGSTPGKGSTFWVELQKAPAHRARLPVEPNDPVALNTAKVKILYVEDNPANLKLVNTILGRLPGFAVFSATDAESGLELVSRHRPDIILLDINLPGMDGYEALAELRSSPQTCDTPIIAVTADAMPHDVEQGMEAGFFAYLTKPLEMHELLATISLALKR